MLLQIPELLTADQVAGCRLLLEAENWVDGRITAGHQSARAKDNSQLPEDSEIAKRLGDTILAALEHSPLFMAAALPLKVFPPLLNRYQDGQAFGNHVDNAIRQVAGTPHRVRTDLAAPLFFSNPDDPNRYWDPDARRDRVRPPWHCSANAKHVRRPRRALRR
jgi:PKHD-type hydroxylase